MYNIGCKRFLRSWPSLQSANPVLITISHVFFHSSEEIAFSLRQHRALRFEAVPSSDI